MIHRIPLRAARRGRIESRTAKTAVLLIAALGVLVAIVAGLIASQWRGSPPGADATPAFEASPAQIDEIRSDVTLFCGNCHAVPAPEGFPKVAWREEVRKGFDFYAQSGRTDLKAPPLERVATYFRAQAPDQIIIPPAQDDTRQSPIRFRRGDLPWDTPAGSAKPWIASLRWDRLSPGEPQSLLACDMQGGEIRSGRPDRAGIMFETLARLDNPAHVVPIDLDADGRLDLVVADLGSRLPADHADGRVVWLRRTASGTLETIVIQSGLGRVADVEPGDFDGDGDVDLIVAEFGWHKTGRIVLLENQMLPGEMPKFELQVIDRRPGTIHVPVADLDGDGRLDFVALVSQEHEKIEAFFNEGEGRFRRETIFDAGEPAFGSSGIELIDLDQDGDLDVLYTNGDTFDSFYLKPYHAIRWLEQTSDGSFAVHLLASMPGAHRALAGDFDGDGDFDLAACALIPQQIFGTHDESDFDGLLWLEQISPGRFDRHSLERGDCRHAAMAVGDFDGDGRLDLAVGGFGEGTTGTPAVTVWWNDGRIQEERESRTPDR